MHISSSVSASPIHWNLNSLRDSANFLLAVDRPERERQRKTGVKDGKLAALCRSQERYLAVCAIKMWRRADALTVWGFMAESSTKPESHQPVKPLWCAYFSHITGACESSWETVRTASLAFPTDLSSRKGRLQNINIQSRWTGKGRPYSGVDFTYPGYCKYWVATGRWWQLHWITFLRATVYENSAFHACACVHVHAVG